jgi:hypothetical protein
MLMAVANDARTDSERLIKGFDDLLHIARVFSGRDSNGSFLSNSDMLSTGSLDAWELATKGVIPRDGSESE